MEQTKHRTINFSSLRLSKEVLRIVPFDIIKKYRFIPFDIEKDRLSIVVEDPEDKGVIDNIRLFSGYDLDVFGASKEAILEQIKNIQIELNQDTPSSELESIDLKHDIPSGSNLKDISESTPVVQVVDKLIEMSLKRSASDIHLEPQDDGVFIRFRIDGTLTTIQKLPKSIKLSLASRIKILARLDITEKRIPQDGQFSQNIQGKAVDFRVSTLPGKYGEKIVIRVLDKSNFALDLSQLGFEPMMQSAFEILIQKPQGLILVTGPTGSGKTTTLYSVLNRLRSPLKNVITLEDPIEYELLAGKSNEAGITQVQINSKVGMTFSKGLKASLRQDPDVVMVGEIRDKETAEIAMKASLTGHLVLSTLHTIDSFSTVLRLKDMGIEPYLISATVAGVLAQRLLRVLCEHCKEPYKPPKRALKVLFPKSDDSLLDIKLYRAKGCKKCQFIGYRGRMGIFELLMMTEDLKKFILTGNSGNSSGPWVQKSLRDSGLDMVMQGITTVEEVYRITVD